MEIIFKSRNDSIQLDNEKKDSNGLVDPFFSFNRLLDLFYANTYHRRAIQLKASLLSNVEDGSKLEGQGMTPKDFLYAFILNLEIFGNAFIETANKNIYILPSVEGRVDENRTVYQLKDSRKIALNAKHLYYYSPRSRFYGEPDYLGALLAILTNQKADGFNNAFFENSARADTAVIFENSEPDEMQLNAFKEFFGSNYKGVDNAHKTLILTANGENAKVRIEDLSNVQDISFEKLKNLNRDEIITAHGVPPRMMGIMSSGQLGGGGEVAGQLHSFNELTIIPKQEQIEWFFDSIGFPIKLKPIDVNNFKDDGEIVTSLVSSGIISLAEARSIMGYTK
ncbi:phage portal protein [Campylobacter hyointestinalis]|uniref:phage portal protein n=1 Tax=Campylobacter hyointestinalis TaxID=198 RepID=UPI001BD3475E|nr:phage portal protein [Campylobacter hyointestinalis]MBT0611962.1 phage portal protein [Campylobacter hyointestinalis subsp. hyointestinalis]MDY2999470.1 phage portal protein [Campylobacter hyointestinalis]